MALPASCNQALNRAEAALLALPGFAGTVEKIAAAVAEEAWPVALGLLVAAYAEARSISTNAANAINLALACLRQWLSQTFGGGPVACATTHKVSTVAQGPGVCCAAFSASGLAPVVGARVVATNKNGKCMVCEIKASTSKKNPGMLVFKRGKNQVPGSTVSCPSTSEGCCYLLGQ